MSPHPYSLWSEKAAADEANERQMKHREHLSQVVPLNEKRYFAAKRFNRDETNFLILKPNDWDHRRKVTCFHVSPFVA